MSDQILFDIHAPHHAGRSDAGHRREVVFAWIFIQHFQHRFGERISDNRHGGDTIAGNGLPQFYWIESRLGFQRDNRAAIQKSAQSREQAGPMH